MALPALLSVNSAILVVVNPHDVSGVSSTFRLANKPGVRHAVGRLSPPSLFPAFDGANMALFDDRLTDSIQLLHQISVDEIGSTTPRGRATVGGSIDFAIGQGNIPIDFNTNSDIYPWLRLIWKGKQVRVYQGPSDSKDFNDFQVIYSGFVDDLTHDLQTASIKLAGASRGMNTPIVEDLYLDGVAPDHLVGKPKVKVWGYVRNHQPVLYDEDNNIYHITSALAGSFGVETTPLLSAVENVEVGGVPWKEVSVLDTNVTGQYKVDLVNGTLQLSSRPLSLDVRCDVKTIGWATFTTSDLIQTWLQYKSIAVDSATFTQFETDCPYTVGYTSGVEPVNLQVAIDEAMTGAGGFWTEGDDGIVRLYAIKKPATATDDATYDITDQNAEGILEDGFVLAGIPPRANRIRMEYNRNWSPVSRFGDAVPEDEQLKRTEPGLIVTPTDDEDLRAADPTSVDVPLIRTLFNNVGDVSNVGTRLSEAWNVERRMYDIILATETNSLYKTILINYRMISNKYFRITSIEKNLGANTLKIRVWG